MPQTTGNTPFFSKTVASGVTRWQCSKPPLIPRAYVLDLVSEPLPNRWYAFALVNQAGVYTIRVYAAGSDADLSLEDVDLQAVFSAGPEINVTIPTDDAQAATERFERSVSHVMHGLLAPLASVADIWQRLAESPNGAGVFRAADG